MKTISVQELQSLLANNHKLDLIDVRTPAEFEKIHVPGARCLPLDQLDCKAVLAQHDPVGPIYILCHSGTRAQNAAGKFAGAGYEDCVVVDGGTSAWADAGLPVEQGERSVLPLDRQLQVTVGALVITGVVLAKYVDPSWIWLSGFVGAGLVFAGITGICAMRSLLAVMPWNQARDKSCSSGCCGC